MKKILCALAAVGVLLACNKNNEEAKVEPTSVSLNKHELALVVGETATLSATVAPENASNKSLNWNSASPAVATVDQSGNVTAVAEGQASIIVTTVAGGKTDACIVTVGRDLSLKGISVTPGELTLKRAETASLSVVYTPEDAQNKTVSWASSNPAIATVSAEGIVEAKAEGTATITATAQDGGFTASCTVTVEPNDLKLYYTILYDWSNVYVNGETDQLSGTFDEDSDTRWLKFQSVITLASDGSDLYSMEEYEQELKPEGNYCRHTYYLCKNRKPLYEVHKAENYETVNSFQVRNGTAGILVSDFSFQQFYAIRVNSNGTIDKHNYTGEFTKVYENHCAVAPNGNLYVAAVVSDENYDYYQVLYELATDGSWKEVSREKGAPSEIKIEISENGDIYMMLMKPFYSPYYGYNAVVYKNGEEYSTLYSMESSGVELGLSIAHDHIYAVIHDIDAQKAFEYRDGTLIRTLEFPEDQRLQGERSLYISSTGDVYLGTYHAIYRNDDILYTESDTWFNNFCVTE